MTPLLRSARLSATMPFLRSSAPQATPAPAALARTLRSSQLRQLSVWQNKVPIASYKRLVRVGTPSSVLFSTLSASLSPDQAPSADDSSKMPLNVNSFFDLKAKDKQREEISMKTFENKVILVVNVASKCGFTKQYAGLEELYKKYKDRGLVVIGFPCNQFGGQEPGTEEEIDSFCQVNFGVTFPLMAKIDVNGEQEDPVYTFLKSKKAGLLGLTRIKWNFEKFLIDRQGNVVNRYSSITTPQDIAKDIEKLL